MSNEFDCNIPRFTLNYTGTIRLVDLKSLSQFVVKMLHRLESLLFVVIMLFMFLFSV